MKKHLFSFLGIGLLFSMPLTAQTITDLGMEIQHADVTLMDWDKDGDMDLLISGESGGVINMKAYLNNGTGTYTQTTVPFTPITRSSFDWNDINQDGNVDLIENGFAVPGAFTGIYTSNATGVFTASPISLPQMSPTSGFGDFNNDGYLDIYVFGNNDQGKSKLFFNNKAGGWTDSHAFDTYTFTFDPDVSVVDVDNDRDLDMFITAGDANGSRFSRLFKNNNGVFTEMMIDPIEKGYGSSTWGGVTGDGFPDLMMNGSGNAAETDFKYKIYKNNGGTSFTLLASYVLGQFSTGDGGRFLDWDDDGDLDILMTGWNNTTQVTNIYLNNGAGVFTAYANNASLPGASESSVEVADVDGDTDLDFVVTGFSGNDFDGAGTVGPFNRNIAVVVKNPATTVNTAPTAPTGLKVTGNQASLLFTWNASTDTKTAAPALSYNLFLVSSTGKWFYFPLSDTATGKRRIQKMGNISQNTGWIVKGLPAGTYRWGVQAIDASYMGSTFAKSTFIITANGSLPVLISSYTAVAEGKRARIEWSTASEQNNDRFEVQRSANGRSFETFATVDGKGTTSNANRYMVFDNTPVAGINYYRLMQYNKDGKATDLGIRTVSIGRGKPGITVYPNPSKDMIGINIANLADRRLTVTLTDMSGRMLHTEVITTGSGEGYYRLHTNSNPAPGQYILNVTGDNYKETLKVVVK